MTMNGRVTLTIGASPDAVYAVVSDVVRTPEWSPECHRVEWAGGRGAEPGARFRGWNRLGRARWVDDVVIETADPPRAFAFVASGPPPTRWSWTMVPAADHTTIVTVAYEELAPRPWWRALSRRLRSGVSDREGDLVQNLRKSIAGVKGLAERAPAGG